MLDAYIIEQIRKRDEERRRIHERPALELPLPLPVERDPARPTDDDDDDEMPEEAPRVIIIDL